MGEVGGGCEVRVWNLTRAIGTREGDSRGAWRWRRLLGALTLVFSSHKRSVVV